MIQFADQVRVRLISRAHQKLLKYFNGTVISTFTVPAAIVLFNNLDLDLNGSDSVIAALFNSGPSLQEY